MARIYKPESYNNSYKGQPTGFGYRPVKAVDNTKKIDRQTTQQILDLQEAEKALKRQQGLDQGALEGRWIKNRAAYKEADANMKARQQTINGLLQLSQSALKAYGTVAELQAKEADAQAEMQRFWGDLDKPDPPKTEPPKENFADPKTFQSAVLASEKAAEEVGGEDVILKGDLKTEQREAVNSRSNRIVTGLQAQIALPGYMSDWMRSDNKLTDFETGQVFTPATASTSSQIAQAQQAGFERFGIENNVLGLDSQAQRELLKVARQVRQSQFYSLSSTLDQNLAEATVLQAKETATASLIKPDANLQTIYTELQTGLLGSGKYNGNPKKAGLDALNHILAYAETQGRAGERIIEELEKVTRTNGGTLKSFHKDLFDKSRDNIDNGIYTDAQRQQGINNQQIRDIQDRRMRELENAAGDPAKTREINKRYYNELKNVPGYAAQVERAKIKRYDYNYSPFNILEFDARQRAREPVSNSEWRTAVSSGSITTEEATNRGFRPTQELSLDEEFASDIGPIRIKAKTMATTAVTNVLETVTDTNDRELILAGSGKTQIENLERGLVDRYYAQTYGKNLTADEKQAVWEKIEREATEELKNITYDRKSGTFNTDSFDFGGTAVVPPNAQRWVLSGDNDKKVWNYSAVKPSEYTIKQPSEHLYLNQEEVEAAHDARINNKLPPQSVIDKADALGIPWVDLYKRQAPLFNKAEYLAVPRESFLISTESYGDLTMERIRDAIISKESTNDYTRVNRDSGALGLAQIMPENLPSWSKRYVGRVVSQREFLRNKELQMKIINGHMTNLIQHQLKAGYSGDVLIRRVASIWYSGKGDLYNNKRRQRFGQTVYPSIYDYTMDILARVKRGQYL